MINQIIQSLFIKIFLAWGILAWVSIRIFIFYVVNREKNKEVKKYYEEEFLFPQLVMFTSIIPVIMIVPIFYVLIAKNDLRSIVYALGSGYGALWLFFTIGLVRKSTSPVFVKCLLLIGMEIALGIYIFFY